jgi:RNA-directed DNA polymerase
VVNRKFKIGEYQSMKRIGNIYSKICDIDNIAVAHKMARKDKIHYTEVQKVDANPDYYFAEIQKTLVNKTYKVGEYKCKTIDERGKQRLIMKLPYYPDRIIQWAVMLQIEQYFIKTLCYHSCASIPCAGNARVHKLMNKYRRLYDYDYCLDIDVRKFYPNIDRDILKTQLERKFKDKDLLWLLFQIVDSSPKDENSLDDKYVRGIPIGSYLSQYLANFYLAHFDHWLKEEKHLKCVVRYMDNIIILSNDKNELHQLRKEIEIYLWNNLHLKLKGNWQVYPLAARPIDFIGYRYGKDYTLLRKATCQRFKRLCYKIHRNNYCSEHDYRSLTSYYGVLKWCDSKRLWNKYYSFILPILKKQGYYIKPFNPNTTKGGNNNDKGTSDRK